MNRRTFVRQVAASALTVQLLSVTSCSGRKSESDSGEESFELAETTVADLQRRMEDGRLTAKRITELYLERIREIDKSGPSLNSVIEINPDAEAIAESLDRERRDGKIRGPLHGIPVLIKDNINTGDKMMTTAGSLALENHIASEDAFIIARLREAGAVILGKTNLSEWANFRSSRSSSGWSSRGGQTRNPYYLDRNPCGSSSGSGTAVSANLCAIAIGTETNGSIACPSSINGVVGIKPTVGLWSRSGIIPISHTQDTAGPMARTVEDAAALLGPLTGEDKNDIATTGSVGRSAKDYRQYLTAGGLKGKRIGVEKSFMEEHEAVDALLRQAMDDMRKAGAEIVEVDLLKEIKIPGAEYTLLQFEFKDGLNRYLASSGAAVKSLADVIDFNKRNEARVMPYFKQEILEDSNEKGSLESEEYKDALSKVLSVRETIDRVLKAHSLDAICGPANGPSWCTDLVNGDSFTGYGMYSPGAMAGYPHITVPMGEVFGLPVGIAFTSTAFDEPRLIGIAYAYEQASRRRRAPRFLTGTPATS